MAQAQIMWRSPIGNLFLRASEKGLQAVSFFKSNELSLLEDLRENSAENQVLRQAQTQVQEYFLGKRRSFDVDLDLQGTPFQISVWNTLLSIPYGSTMSYREVAERISNPKAVRAVGSANARNPLCLVVPCHRVIAADGSLGGYVAGVATKNQLLEFEKTCLESW